MIRIPLRKFGGYLTENRTVVEIPDHKARELIRDIAAQLRERNKVQ